jgi:hypothetical protein
MKRAIFAVVVACAASLVPVAGHANAALDFECSNVMPAGGSASCTVPFELKDARAVALVDSGANFDDVAARGPLTLDWKDSTGKTVASYGCFGNGVPLQSMVGQTRLVLCTQYGPLADTYTPGMQTMVVRAWNTFCPGSSCTFHGRLHLADPTDILNPA